MKNEINWNLESQNLLFYLNNKPVSFYKWNKYLDLSSSIKYTVLQDLIDNDYAVLKHDETNVSVEPEGIYYLIENIGLETTRKLFNFPEYSDFYTVVESTSTDISSKDFTLSYRHFSNIDPFPINPQRYFPNSVFWTSDSKNIALMRKEEFELIDKLEKFNNRGNCTLSEQYQRYGDIQKLIKSSSHLAIETPLQGQSVFIPEKMELDLNTEQDQIQIQVNITDSNPEKDYIQQNFNERLDATNDTQLVYTIPTKKGGTDRIHIPFTEAQREQLHKVRSHNFEARNGKNIGDVLSHPEKYFDLSEIDISSTFSERVIGLGEYQPKTKSFSVQINNEWFPGIEIDDPVEGTQNIVFENEQELNQFSEDIKRAKESNKQTVPYKNYQIPLEEAIQIQQISEDQFRTPDRPVSPKKQVLLISENLDELEYSEEKQLNDVGDNFWAIPNLSSEYDLKSHQKVGIGWMQELFRQDAPGCLLADDMGLGKTLQVMSFLEWAVSELDKPCKALILAPKSLLQNWENEYFRFFPTGNYRTIRLGSDEKEYSKKISYHAETWGQNTLVITNYETLRFNQIEFGKIKWDIVVADEAQKIKTPGTLVTNASKALNTDFRIALTGTPVENTFQDLWCLMDFCLPGLLGSRKDFNKHFSESKNATDEDLIEIGKKIREKIGPYILRRNKSILGNELPSKYISNIEEHHDHFPIDCSTLQRLMPITQKRAYDEVIEMMQASKDKRMTLKAISDLKKISDHPDYNSSFYAEYSGKEHIFWKEFAEDSARIIAILPVLEKIKKQKEKVLIFAEFRFTQYILKMIFESLFRLQNIRIINGDTSVSGSKVISETRQGIVDQFNETPGFNILILSPLAAGTGLTITGANHVIHYSRHWNPAKENQATDRAYRIGQKKSVYIYYPMAVSNDYKTFDHILNDLLSRKNQLADSALFPSARYKVTEKEMVMGMTTQSK